MLRSRKKRAKDILMGAKRSFLHRMCSCDDGGDGGDGLGRAEWPEQAQQKLT
jgi:hypothetical protein